MIIDTHCHAGSAEPDFRGQWPIDQLVADWDANGVGAGIVANMIGDSMAEANDQGLAYAKRHPRRVYPYMYLDMRDIGAARGELQRCRRAGGFVGVKLHPDAASTFPYGRHCYPLYEEIAAAKLPVLIHSGTPPYSNPLACAAAARDFPAIPWILGHFGLADYSWECFPAAEIAPNLMVDVTLNGTIQPQIEWIERFGAERMVWGTDFPYGRVSYERQHLDLLAKPGSREHALIGGENTQRIFGIP